MKKLYQRIVLMAVSLIMAITPIILHAEPQGKTASSSDGHNVVIVLDESNSINYTDPKELRFEAIDQFTGLLAEKKSMLGGIVFSTNVESSVDLMAINEAADKEKIKEFFRSSQTYSYTNIGAAIDQAVAMIKKNGNPDLPSAIVLLSDGNSEMPSEDELQQSLDLKAEAIQEARDQKIQIYSVCLNANSKADITEMEQISQATDGVFKEIKEANDLKDVFNSFYNFIYGTSTIRLADRVFPSNGVVKTPFFIPGMGVEEVNIVIYGETSDISLITPSGETYGGNHMSITQARTFTMIKLKEVIPGEWVLITKGKPGNPIKINMVFNTNLWVEVTAPAKKQVEANQEIEITAVLKSGDTSESQEGQNTGYKAVLEVMNAKDEVAATQEMEQGAGAFTTTYAFPEGTYIYQVSIQSDYISKTSDRIGPILSTKTEKKEPANTPPLPITDTLEKIVYIWPLKGGQFQINLDSMFQDKEDAALSYRIVSTSFLDGKDYTLTGNKLLQNHFSLSKGSYTIQAMDSKGLSSEAELRIITRNVGVMMLIGLGLAALAAVIVFAVLLYIALNKPFRGTIYVQGFVGGEYSEKIMKKPKRGRCSLNVFGLPRTGYPYANSYFQATGKRYIELVAKQPLYYMGRPTNRIHIDSGPEVMVTIEEAGNQRIYIRFDSKISSQRPGNQRSSSRSTPKRKTSGINSQKHSEKQGRKR